MCALSWLLKQVFIVLLHKQTLPQTPGLIYLPLCPAFWPSTGLKLSVLHCTNRIF